MRQGFFLVFVFAEKLVASVKLLVFFVKADGEVSAGGAKRMEEVRVFVSGVRVFHVFKVSQQA